MPAQVLPDPIPAPSKHDGMRPTSSHEVSEMKVFPPSQSLSPQRMEVDLSPPVKRASPKVERMSDVMQGVVGDENANGNGVGH